MILKLPSPPPPTHFVAHRGILRPTTSPPKMLPTSRLLQTTARIFKARRPWPPDFSLLTQKEQFRLERKYRRRAKLKWARPRLQKAVKIAQWSIISC
jgi:hypothetical protein